MPRDGCMKVRPVCLLLLVLAGSLTPFADWQYAKSRAFEIQGILFGAANSERTPSRAPPKVEVLEPNTTAVAHIAAPQEQQAKVPEEVPEKVRSASNARFNLIDMGGPWPHQLEFASSLLADLPEEFAQGEPCDVVVFTGWNPSGRTYDGLHLAEHNVSRVWLIINQEPPNQQSCHKKFVKVPKIGSAVLVGNWWNATQAEYSDEDFASIWLPFGSLYFAELKTATPMDLRNRTRSERVGPLGKPLHSVWASVLGEEKRANIIYQAHQCMTNAHFRDAPYLNYREKFWDTLNQRMREELQETGYAAGRCNGLQESGKRLPEGHTHSRKFDECIAKYSYFKFVLALENTLGEDAPGYITEKFMNAFLAGAVPIYAGVAQAGEFMNKESYLQLEPGRSDNQSAAAVIAALKDASVYDKMWQESAVSDDQLRRFFSWHPAVWPTHGDSLRRRIVRELDRLCRKPTPRSSSNG